MRKHESHSSITTYTTCPKKYYYTYELGKVPIGTTVDIEYGSGFGALLEHNGSPPTKPELSALHSTVLAEMYYGYTKIYQGDFAPGNSVIREVAFEYDRFRGRFDALDESNGRLIETKTTRRIVDENYWSDKSYNQQAMLYLYVAKKLGYKVDRVVYDVVRRPMLRLKQREKHEAYIERIRDWLYNNRHDVFVRRTLGPWSNEQLEQNYSNMVGICRVIENESVFPEHRNSCYAYGTLCPYYGVCFEGDSLDDPEHFTGRNP